jgi:hypothetical protein
MACDIDETTYYRWMERAKRDAAAHKSSIYTEFCKSAQCARAKARTYHVQLIMRNAEAGKDSRSSLEYLSRTDPDHWSRRESVKMEHSGANGGAITVSTMTDEEVERRAREILAKRQR